MGAETFVTFAEGKTAPDAFAAAVAQASYDHGHAGYTGTIAEKTSFQVVEPPPNLKGMNHRDIEDYIETLFQKNFNDEPAPMPFWDDKWGPAACMKVGEEDYYFFGWASS